MKIIGVTGGIGSGKSTVSKILSSFGANVIDADKIARSVVRKGEKAWEEIILFFGTAIVDASGELDRKMLGEIVFNDSEKLEELNRITHKYIKERIIEQINNARDEKKSRVLVIDIPIPFENGFVDLVDEVWVVTADIGTRINRIIERNGLGFDEAVQRINSQRHDKDYLELGDKIINNNGNIEELNKTVHSLFCQIDQGDYIV